MVVIGNKSETIFVSHEILLKPAAAREHHRFSNERGRLVMNTTLKTRIINISAATLGALALLLDLGAHAAKAAGEEVVATVSFSTQTMQVTIAGRRTYDWPVSTARKGYVTPTGSFKPTRMHRMWYSKKYDNAPMPHSVFFHGGCAVHATDAVKRLGRPASHGCIRLHPDAAADFYALVRLYGPSNTRIVIER